MGGIQLSLDVYRHTLLLFEGGLVLSVTKGVLPEGRK